MGDSISWLHDNNRTEEAEAVEQVFDFRLKAAGTAYRANIDVENIEELFSLASASEGESHTDYVTKAIAATLDYAQRTTGSSEAYLNTQVVGELPNRWRLLSQAEGANRGGYTHACPLYHLYAGMLSGYFSESSPSTRNTIITFNYDTLVEDALADLSTPFHYGLSSAAATLQEGAKCSLSDQALAGAIPILKLHGSINWATPDNLNEMVKVYGSYDDVRARGERILLLPPTWRKAFGGHLTGIWETALKAISEATRIIIIGFSMPPTDTHFKYLIASGLRDNISLRKLIFVNPSLRQEAEILRNNLFNILRPELESRGIIVTRAEKTHEFLFDRENGLLTNRYVSSNYIRIGLNLNGVIHIQVRG
ncbi:MAG: hypothetical protein QOG71_2247 [Pyrinomonadaceae bacterium]|nr:hypothetical protein [Pyrinomonadaceae bacterium]